VSRAPRLRAGRIVRELARTHDASGARAGTSGSDAAHIAAAVPRSRWRVASALMALVALMASEGQALACPSCFGQAEGPMIDAARLGIWLLLGVTLCLQGAFAAFFLCLRRRARRAADQALDEEWSRLQREHDRRWRSA